MPPFQYFTDFHLCYIIKCLYLFPLIITIIILYVLHSWVNNLAVYEHTFLLLICGRCLAEFKTQEMKIHKFHLWHVKSRAQSMKLNTGRSSFHQADFAALAERLSVLQPPVRACPPIALYKTQITRFLRPQCNQTPAHSLSALMHSSHRDLWCVWLNNYRYG